MVVPDPDFQLFHAYRRLVRRGLVRPLTHDCGNEYLTGLGHDDHLVLRCYHCNVVVVPGHDLVAQVRSVVNEHG